MGIFDAIDKRLLRPVYGEEEVEETKVSSNSSVSKKKSDNTSDRARAVHEALSNLESASKTAKESSDKKQTIAQDEFATSDINLSSGPKQLIEKVFTTINELEKAQSGLSRLHRNISDLPASCQSSTHDTELKVITAITDLLGDSIQYLAETVDLALAIENQHRRPVSEYDAVSVIKTAIAQGDVKMAEFIRDIYLYDKNFNKVLCSTRVNLGPNPKAPHSTR